MKRSLFLSILISFSLIAFSQKFTPGYTKTIKGDDFNYHSPQPDAGISMLIRSQDARDFIEWETAPVPYNNRSESVTFLMLAGIDVNAEQAHSWDVYIDGLKYFTISTPTKINQEGLKWMGLNASVLEFKTTEVDKYGDLMGYLKLTLNSKKITPGKSVTIKVKPTESAGSQTWFMVFKYTTRNHVRVSAENAIRKSPEGGTQVLKTEAIYYGQPEVAVFTIGKDEFEKQLDFGYNVHYLEIPVIKRKTNIPVKAVIANETLVDEKVSLEPVKEMTIFLLHHSHVDIGYTHVQEEVEKLQWEHLEKAIELAEASQDNPPGSRFRWNTEVMWAVESYLKNADNIKRKQFLDAVKKGWIELDGMFANMLTGLCSSEELFHLFDAGVDISNDAGVRLKSAMITDIPGWSWGVVAPMAQSGIRYFSAGTNRGHRIGSIVKELGDKPFYWVSPSGEEKVFTWIHQEGYSLFHTGLGGNVQKNLLSEEKIFPYLNWLAENNYPYDMTVLRYNIGSDNGPPDDNLCELVEAWNEKYESPQLFISTVSEAFGTIEARFRETIPEYRGDITGYWEDGAISSAYETTVNRRNAARLGQAEVLFSMGQANQYPALEIDKIWNKIMLYNEHTWGSWNSISEPEAPFTTQQWETKRSFALEAEKASKELIQAAFKSSLPRGGEVEILEVVNTNSWTRSGWASYPVDVNKNAYRVFDSREQSVSTMTTHKNELAFYVTDLPAFSSRKYFLKPVDKHKKQKAVEGQLRLENDYFSLLIDKANGSIKKLVWKKTGEDFVNHDSGLGLNQYIYIAGRSPEDPEFATVKNVFQVDKNTLSIKFEAPGCQTLQSIISLDDFAPRIEITNNIFKAKVYDPEGVHFAFPFSVKNGKMHYDMALADCRPETDQLPGSNKNFISIENWVDISNNNFGITWSSPDAPLVEVGAIMNDPISYGYIDHLEPSQTFFSYVMNNYWETNYLAAQEGVVSIKYSIEANDGFDPAQAEKIALEQRIPLLVFPAGNTGENKKLGIYIENPNIIILASRIHEDELLISLQNYSDNPETLNYKNLSSKLFTADFWGNRKEAVSQDVVIPGKGIRHFLVYR